MKTAGYFVLISAALHVVGVALSGFASSTLFLLGPALLYVLLYAGLARNMMWVAWLTFITMLIGASAALSAFFEATPVPSWVFMAIVAADLIAALLLFGAIWAGRGKRGQRA